MFKERKENAVQADSWTKHPCDPRLFDDYDQYLDFLSVWYSSWSSRDPGHVERTDFSDEAWFDATCDANNTGVTEEHADFGFEDCSVADNGSENVSVSDISADVEDFLMKDRSRALRRRSDALHKEHVKKLSEVLDRKVVREGSRSTMAAYKRVSILQFQCIELTTWHEELELLRMAIGDKKVNDLYALGFGNTALEANGLRLSYRNVGAVPVAGIRAERCGKQAKLYFRDTNHKKKRDKATKKAEVKAAEEAAKKAAEEAWPEDKPTKGKALISIQVDAVLPDVNVSNNSEHSRACSRKEHFDGQRGHQRKGDIFVAPMKLQETKIPTVVVKPEPVFVFVPRVSAAGFPYYN